MPCRRRDRRGAAAATVGAALAAAGRGALAPAAFAGPAVEPAPARGAYLRVAAAGSGREARAPAATRSGPGSAERQSGVQHIHWCKSSQAWRVRYMMKNGPDKGYIKQPTFRPKEESPEEVERARLAAAEELRRLEEEDRIGRARISVRIPAERQSGVQYISWFNREKAWRVQYKLKSGPDKGRRKQLRFRPKDESLEEVEQARLAAVEALRRLEEEDLLGRVRVGRCDRAEHQSGIKHIVWDKTNQRWRVNYKMKNGRDEGTMKRSTFRPKDESLEEVEQARLAAVEALRRLQEEDVALGPISSDEPHASRDHEARAAFPGPAAEPTPLRGAPLRFVVASSDRDAQAPAAEHRDPSSAEFQSGVKHINWGKRTRAWRVDYRIKNGPDKGCRKQASFLPKNESPEEVEQARLAAVEALQRLQEEDRALGPSSPGGRFAGRDREEAPAASAEEEQLAAFRERYPVDDSAFDLLAKQPVEVQFMVISKFCPPKERQSDYSTLLAKAVQTITSAARRPRQVATFSTGCFWASQRLFDRVRGIVNTTVGYTGGNTTKKPTYESVQLGDGHSEAIRIEFDPELITYDALLTHFDSVRERTPAGLAFAEGAQSHTTTRQSGTTTQYHSAVWYHDEEQKKVAQACLRQGAPAVHVARLENWHDAEKHHQKFYQKGCSVQ